MPDVLEATLDRLAGLPLCQCCNEEAVEAGGSRFCDACLRTTGQRTPFNGMPVIGSKPCCLQYATPYYRRKS